MSRANIMIVEDEGLVALELQESLESMGYSVSGTFSEARTLLDTLFSDKPDLILMDIRIKGEMDGIDAAKYIRAEYMIPVIFVTAHSDEKTILRAREAESYGYILKPFEDRALKAAIEMALYKSRQENLLKGSNDWLNIILRCMGEAILVIDLKGFIKYDNPLVRDILGSDRDLTGKKISTILKLLEPDGTTPALLPFHKSIMNGEFFDNLDYLLSTGSDKPVAISLALAPLKNDKGMTVGAVCVFKPRHLPSKEDKLAQEERDEPVKIQKNLLPENGLTLNGIRLDWFFYPSAYGSGDIFNFFAIDGTHTGFYLLDVMGHGFSAAIISVTIHRLLSPEAETGSLIARPRKPAGDHPNRRESDNLPTVMSPRDVLAELNRRFFFESNSLPFFTIVYGVIDTAAETGTIARAGHLHPLLHKKNGQMLRLEAEGPAIGIFEKGEFTEKQFHFGKGDRLYAYSDGLVESLARFTAGDADGMIRGSLEKSRKKSQPEAVTVLEQELLARKGQGRFDDDVVFMGLERV
jgi:serine phosphatase RsbU (regulator of sigma subunit)/CheY-like chemotaxis protein